MSHTEATWPPGGGEMGARIRAYDWSKNPLGPTENWHPMLKAIVEFTLVSPQPTKILWGPELIQIYNDPFAAIIGGKHPAGLGQRAVEAWAEIMHLSAPYYARALAGEALVLNNTDWKIARSGIEDVSFAAYLTPVKLENGVVAGLHVVCLETTEQVKAAQERDRAEQALKYSESRLHTASEVVGLGCYSWNLKDDTQYWDFRARNAWGFPPEMRLDREKIRQQIHPEDRAKVDSAIIKCLDPRGDGTFECEYRITRMSDGAERWIRSRGRASFYEGRPVDVLCVTTDVTDARMANEKVRAHEERLSSMMEQMPLGVGLFNADGALQEANSEFRRYMVGGTLPSRDPSARLRWRGMKSDGSRLEPADYPDARALKGETASGVEFLHMADDGAEIWTRVGAAPFKSRDGVTVGVLMTVRNIDEEKRASQVRVLREVRPA
jgi:PAS domain S-box-containing protein